MITRWGVVYRCYSEDGRLLYIGSTGDIKQRMSVHGRQSSFYDRIAHVVYGRHQALDAARAEEVAAIVAERPLLNQQGNPDYAALTPKQQRVRAAEITAQIPLALRRPPIIDERTDAEREAGARECARVMGSIFAAFIRPTPAELTPQLVAKAASVLGIDQKALIREGYFPTEAAS